MRFPAFKIPFLAVFEKIFDVKVSLHKNAFPRPQFPWISAVYAVTIFVYT